MIYKNEAAFSTAFCKKLRSLGLVVTRIESGGTKRGIPDIHWAGYGQEGWIELKIVHHSYYGGDIKIPWRPGQQGWAFEYMKHKRTPSTTVVACNNCILIVPMVRHFQENWVMQEDISEILSDIKELTP
jgi:Holliday junction resolvase